MSTENDGTVQDQTETKVDAQVETDTQSQGDGGNDGNGSPDETPEWIAAPEIDQDTRDWLQKSEVKDIASLAKKSHEQAKLLGNAIRVPGEKATDEERNAYLNKLGRPETADAYKFTVPKDLPENAPYDGEEANKFKAFAHSIGLTQAQAAAMHDYAISDRVEGYGKAAHEQVARFETMAKAETEKLVKLLGPLNSPTARAHMEFADRLVNEVGGEEAWSELERLNAIVRVKDKDGKEQKIVASAALAMMFGKAGMALLAEDRHLRGSNDPIDNPFADGPGFNLTTAMKTARSDPEMAKSLITAAGKKLSDFGLRD